MWKILGALLWGFILHSKALESNLSMLEGKVYSIYLHQKENVLTESEYDYIVSLGPKLDTPGIKFYHYFFGNMITRRYGFTYINQAMLKCLEDTPFYVNDMRKRYSWKNLKPVKRFINFKDFISDVPTESCEISVGIAVMELEKNVKALTTYVPSPSHQSDVNYMVGFNKIRGMQPTPDRTFVKLRVVKEDKSECAILPDSVDFCIKTKENQFRVDDSDLGSLVYLGSTPVGINMGNYQGYGGIQLISSDDYSEVKKRCEEKSASFAGTSALPA